MQLSNICIKNKFRNIKTFIKGMQITYKSCKILKGCVKCSIIKKKYKGGLNMQKSFTKYLSCIMLVALFVFIIFSFIIQTYSAQSEEKANSSEKLALVQEKIISNNQKAEELEEEFGNEALIKTKAFSYMIELDPSIIENYEKMQEIAELLDVDEVHVTDEKGILYWGNIKDYYGFDFASGDQTKPFLEILNDPALEIVQEPQENATIGKLFQYIGIARRDRKGIVQVGVRPEALEEALSNNTIDKILGDIEYGKEGYVFAVDKTTGNILAHQNQELIGKACSEVGLPKNIVSSAETSGLYVVDGKKVFISTTIYEDMIIGTALPETELYSERKSQITMFFIMTLVIFIILIVAINLLLNIQVIKGIKNIIEKLKGIIGGNLDEHIEVRMNKEFEALSDNINKMVASIKENMEHSIKKAEENEILLDEQKKLFKQIKIASGEINEFSHKTLNVSRQISSGAVEQTNSVEELIESLNVLSSKFNSSFDICNSVSDAAKNAINTMSETNGDMDRLISSMEEISVCADRIENIINEIDNIASSTNMLALNASIEAARAGENGKGFAVVASQVGELANQSAEAAKETEKLIESTLMAIRKGEQLVKMADEKFEKVMQVTQKAGVEMSGLVDISNEQVRMVENANSKIQYISAVVGKTMDISIESEETSEQLAVQAENLKKLIE